MTFVPAGRDRNRGRRQKKQGQKKQGQKNKAPAANAPGLRIGPFRLRRYRDARLVLQFALYQATSWRLSACWSVLSDTPMY